MLLAYATWLRGLPEGGSGHRGRDTETDFAGEVSASLVYKSSNDPGGCEPAGNREPLLSTKVLNEKISLRANNISIAQNIAYIIPKVFIIISFSKFFW